VSDRLPDHLPILEQRDRFRARHGIEKFARELRHPLARNLVHV